jgi:hypothetical protein
VDADEEDRQYHEFRIDLLNSKFRGAHTEAEMIERLINLCHRGNRHALRALSEAKLTYAPGALRSSSVYAKGAVYSLVDVSSPPKTGTEGSDHLGLWRDGRNGDNSRDC